MGICFEGSVPVRSLFEVHGTRLEISLAAVGTRVNRRALEMPQVAMVLQWIQSDDSGVWRAISEWLGEESWFACADVGVVG
jgi:hypothetical protein